MLGFKPVSAAVPVLLIAVYGCAASLPPPPDPAALPSEAELLSGNALFGERVLADEQPLLDLREMDDAMRAFVNDAVPSHGTTSSRLERLLQHMNSTGLLDIDYDAAHTGTARDTFHARTGNCLAFTNLFVALAREAGLRVSYQQVEVPPSWSADGNMLMLHQHVNVRIDVPDTSISRHSARVVDFNTPMFRGNYPQTPVADEVIDALYYNNLAVEAMKDGEHRLAFARFLRAIEIEPDVSSAWSNLSVLYRRHGLDNYAEASLHRALRADRRDRVAMSNLARIYDARGEAELAEAYRERLRNHQRRNPYYHYFLAETALQEGDTDTALAAVNRAIRMRDIEHKFYFLRAQILDSVGDREAARFSLMRAEEHAAVAAVRAQYRRKLETLD